MSSPAKLKVTTIGKGMPVPIKIKQEILDEDEEVVQCRMCDKKFCNEKALQNHARLEHFEVFALGDPEVYTERCHVEKIIKKAAENIKRKSLSMQSRKLDPEKIKKKTEELISSMEPTSLMSLASEDVSYIIIKSDEVTQEVKKTKIEKLPKEKPKKEVQPITGPFECLQPSQLVEDGTCHQIFFSCCEYSLHYRDEHTRRRKGLRCQVCEKLLSPGVNDNVDPYTCLVCGATHSSSKELTEHTNVVHVKLKPFQCSVCQKRFTQQGGLQQHMRMHTGDRPFPCTFCQKAFTQKSGLDQHLRIHTKTKPYRCVVCDKAFCQSIHLKQHMRTHTNVAPFQCAICEKKFKQASHLNYHLRAHNADSLTDEQRQKYKELIGLIEHENLIEIEVDLDDMQTEVVQESVQVECVDDGDITLVM